MPIVGETERVVLRTWEARHEQPYHEHCNTIEVMQYVGGVQEPWSISEDVRWFERCYEEFGHTLWVVEDRTTGAFLGFCGLDRLRHGVPNALVGEIEIGWRLRREAWGKGFATEAAELALHLAFLVRRMPRVISRAAKQNVASLRVMNKLGMTKSSELKAAKGGLLYSIDRQTWLER